MINVDDKLIVAIVQKFNTARELWHHAGSYDGDPATMKVTQGPKYLRLIFHSLVRNEPYGDRYESDTCAGFIDRNTGDILYPKGWNGPTKRARGNIFAADGGQSAVAWHSVAMAEEVRRG